MDLPRSQPWLNVVLGMWDCKQSQALPLHFWSTHRPKP